MGTPEDIIEYFIKSVAKPYTLESRWTPCRGRIWMYGSTGGIIPFGETRMTRCDDLLAKAKNSPKGLRFSELLALAACHGWVLDRTEGSHHILKKASEKRLMDFQKAKDGKAKSYQVKQFLNSLED